LYTYFFLLIKKKLPNLVFTRNNIIQTSKKLFNFSFFVFANKLSNIINTNFLQFLLSAFYSPAIVPYFMIPMKLVNLIQGALANLSNVVFPYSSNLSAKNLTDSLKKLFLQSSSILFAFSFPLYLLLCIFSYEILYVWTGWQFASNSWLVLIFLSLAYMMSSITIVPTNILYGMGYSKFVGLVSLILLPITLFLQVIFIKLFNYNGAAIATFIGAFAGPVFFIYVSIKILKISFFELAKIIPKKILLGLFFLICFLFLKFFIDKLELINSNYFILGYGVLVTILFYAFLLKEKKDLIYKIIKK